MHGNEKTGIPYPTVWAELGTAATGKEVAA
jgi:hypothetical protein